MKYIYIIFLIFLIPSKSYSQDVVKLQKSLDSLKVLKETYQQKILEISNESLRIEKIIARVKFEESKGEAFRARFTTGIYLAPEGMFLKTLKEGSLVKVIDQAEKYYKISYNDITGWVIQAMLISESEFKADSISRIAKTKANAEKLKAQKTLQSNQQAEARANILKKYGITDGQKILNKKIWLGMTDDMARLSWGKPSDINRSVGSWGVHEQWIYGNTYLYFENGILTSWQD
jgi:hypothetical protein